MLLWLAVHFAAMCNLLLPSASWQLVNVWRIVWAIFKVDFTLSFNSKRLTFIEFVEWFNQLFFNMFKHQYTKMHSFKTTYIFGSSWSRNYVMKIFVLTLFATSHRNHMTYRDLGVLWVHRQVCCDKITSIAVESMDNKSYFDH